MLAIAAIVEGMKLLRRDTWINFLALIPGTSLTLLTIAVAFLRFYDPQDFEFLRFIEHPRLWSNRFTVAAVLVALVNFGVEWDRRNRETDRLAAEKQRRTEERERAARRARIEARYHSAQIRFQLDPSEENRLALTTVLAIFDEYRDTL